MLHLSLHLVIDGPGWMLPWIPLGFSIDLAIKQIMQEILIIQEDSWQRFMILG